MQTRLYDSGHLSRWLRTLIKSIPSLSVKATFSLLLVLLLSLSTLSDLQAAPRRDFAEQYRPGRQILVDTRREGDSLRLFLRFPGNNFRPGQVLYVAGWASYAAKQPKWQYPVRMQPGHFRQEPNGSWVDIALPLSWVPLGQIISVQPSLIPASTPASTKKQPANTTLFPPPNSDYTDGALWLNITPARLNQSYISRLGGTHSVLSPPCRLCQIRHQ
jgi:hypothetical protein